MAQDSVNCSPTSLYNRFKNRKQAQAEVLLDNHSQGGRTKGSAVHLSESATANLSSEKAVSGAKKRAAFFSHFRIRTVND